MTKIQRFMLLVGSDYQLKGTVYPKWVSRLLMLIVTLGCTPTVDLSTQHHHFTFEPKSPSSVVFGRFIKIGRK